MKIGFIGLGTMGGGMAANILEAGLSLTVYNRTEAKAKALVDKGATFAATIADLGDCDVVVTMVSDDKAISAICFDGGLVDAMKPGAIHLSSSTVSVQMARKLEAAHAEAGQVLVSAPVNGRGDLAAAGNLFVISAGPSEARATCAPVFDAIGQKTLDFGADQVAAVVVKLAVNCMIADSIGVMAEAYNMVERWGVDKTAFHAFISNGLFGAPIFKIYGAMIAEDTYQPANFPVPLGLKDVNLAVAAGEEVNMPMPIASSVRNGLLMALAQGLEAEDWSVLSKATSNSLKP
ncbi:NAD(P)-dependent oxidoreductase [Roseobacter sp. YSTF-M11]|uniref:NAD(P)-dependent oxidoreductase n=1 Tax=Roseobacter insulae TaxID=2859783 RepID=A0A9X1FT14_9RHOB|nr:NAD(P)-dependent oxidoreductase [Roseobacter insulae]MBW4706373.1 NAD(P)-dependent oxidoreductase [Roseobacter insulae]